MVEVCQGTKTKNDMLAEALEQYQDMYVRARANFAQVVDVRSSHHLHWSLLIANSGTARTSNATSTLPEHLLETRAEDAVAGAAVRVLGGGAACGMWIA